ncbi:hypothetical protein [Luteimicrobium subarcticum]|uniref:Uncharacterized protein n=1 Tax=Luteimicrobium subarcticum TaxID=620910 RepID=A0A2M8WJ36_9MICO|nr:hypothetical protein [Luteimicrobium subarcticum]PJI90939.1 hypothetical protein CLV34_2197 [Luteimicrobium subarcticum]
MENGTDPSGHHEPTDAPHRSAAASALAEVAAGRATLAQQMRRTPPWYDAVYGLGCGLYVAAFALPFPWMAAGMVVAVVVFSALIGVFRARTGIVLTLSVHERALVALLVAVGAVLVLAAVASFVGGRHGAWWLVVLAAVVAGAAAATLSRRYTRVAIALLGSEAA